MWQTLYLKMWLPFKMLCRNPLLLLLILQCSSAGKYATLRQPLDWMTVDGWVGREWVPGGFRVVFRGFRVVRCGVLVSVALSVALVCHVAIWHISNERTNEWAWHRTRWTGGRGMEGQTQLHGPGCHGLRQRGVKGSGGGAAGPYKAWAKLHY